MLQRGVTIGSCFLLAIILGSCADEVIAPPQPARLAFVIQPSNAMAGSQISPALTVAVQDASGNTVATSSASVTIALGSNTAGGTLSGTATVTAANGVATFSGLTINKVGTGYTLQVTSGTLTAATSTAFAITPGPAHHLAFAGQPSDHAAGAPITPAVSVKVVDAFDNTVTDATGTVTVAIGTNAGGGSLAGTLTAAPASGVATFADLSVNRPGAGYTLAASSGSLAGATSSPFTITTGAAHHLAFTAEPSDEVAGASITPAVSVGVFDAAGNLVTTSSTSVTIAIGANPGGGILSGTATIHAAAGVATFSNLSINRAAAGYTLVASASTLGDGTSASFSIQPGTPHHLLFVVQPTGQNAGTVITPAVTVGIVDAFDNVVTTATDAVTVAISNNPGGGTLFGTVTVSAVSGVATFSGLSIERAGTGYTLNASAASLAGATSDAFAITPAAAHHLRFGTQPSDAVAGTSITPSVAVAVVDAFDNVVTGASHVVTVAIGANPGGGALSGTVSVGAGSGIASFANLSIQKAGAGYTLTASAPGVTGATSDAFDITFSTANRLEFLDQPPSTTAGAVFTIRVEVQDAFGNTVTTATNAVTYAFGSNTTGATLSGTKLVNAVAGLATTDLSVNRPGTGYTLTATASGLLTATSDLFAITAGPPRRLAFINAPTQAVSGEAITPAVSVAVQDSLGNRVLTATNAITIEIGTNPSGGTLSGTTTTSAASGIASFPGISIDQTGSGYTLVATASGLTSVTSGAFSVSTGASFASIHEGFYLVCGITSTSAAYCWGSNGDGQVGDGTNTTSKSRASPVSGGLSFVDIGPGAFHTCGVTVANAAYCWGDNSQGQLGNGTGNPSNVPVAVPGGILFSRIASAFFHTCGVTTAGDAYCWGQNVHGQLGDSSTTQRNGPALVKGGLTFAMVSVSNASSCGLTVGGDAYCWGPETPTPAPVPGGLSFVTLTAGWQKCGVTVSGDGYCWGSNTWGGLGDGTTTDRPSPTLVTGGHTWTAISSENDRTCGIVSGGATYCWGWGAEGNLGNGTVDHHSVVPVRVLRF